MNTKIRPTQQPQYSQANRWKGAPALVFGGIVLGAMLSLSACGEIDQKAKTEKVYAKKLDTHAYDGDKFKGDKAKWEASLAQRNGSQNESVRINGK